MKCPKCGTENSLKYQDMYQYMYEYPILKNGSIGKKRKKIECGSEDFCIVYCKNCGKVWNGRKDDFDIINHKIVFLEE